MIKLKVRETSLIYARQRKKERTHQEEKIEKNIASLEMELEGENISELQRGKVLDMLKIKKEQQEKFFRISHKRRHFKITVPMVQ